MIRLSALSLPQMSWGAMPPVPSSTTVRVSRVDRGGCRRDGRDETKVCWLVTCRTTLCEFAEMTRVLWCALPVLNKRFGVGRGFDNAQRCTLWLAVAVNFRQHPRMRQGKGQAHFVTYPGRRGIEALGFLECGPAAQQAG